MNTLTPSQQRDIERARELVSARPDMLDALIERAGGHVNGPDPYPEAFGLACNYLGYGLTGAQS